MEISDKIWRKPELICDSCGRKYKRFGWLIRHEWVCGGYSGDYDSYLQVRHSPLIGMLITSAGGKSHRIRWND